uniref:Uncharacterized protein n=1 Tax=Knipowitschia caucasica TaxID=637954 RepID=A0AAV2M0V5_KNICA
MSIGSEPSQLGLLIQHHGGALNTNLTHLSVRDSIRGITTVESPDRKLEPGYQIFLVKSLCAGSQVTLNYTAHVTNPAHFANSTHILELPAFLTFSNASQNDVNMFGPIAASLTVRVRFVVRTFPNHTLGLAAFVGAFLISFLSMVLWFVAMKRIDPSSALGICHKPGRPMLPDQEMGDSCMSLKEGDKIMEEPANQALESMDTPARLLSAWQLEEAMLQIHKDLVVVLMSPDRSEEKLVQIHHQMTALGEVQDKDAPLCLDALLSQWASLCYLLVSLHFKEVQSRSKVLKTWEGILCLQSLFIPKLRGRHKMTDIIRTHWESLAAAEKQFDTDLHETPASSLTPFLEHQSECKMGLILQEALYKREQLMSLLTRRGEESLSRTRRREDRREHEELKIVKQLCACEAEFTAALVKLLQVPHSVLMEMLRLLLPTATDSELVCVFEALCPQDSIAQAQNCTVYKDPLNDPQHEPPHEPPLQTIPHHRLDLNNPRHKDTVHDPVHNDSLQTPVHRDPLCKDSLRDPVHPCWSDILEKLRVDVIGDVHAEQTEQRENMLQKIEKRRQNLLLKLLPSAYATSPSTASDVLVQCHKTGAKPETDTVTRPKTELETRTEACSETVRLGPNQFMHESSRSGPSPDPAQDQSPHRLFVFREPQVSVQTAVGAKRKRRRNFLNFKSNSVTPVNLDLML